MPNEIIFIPTLNIYFARNYFTTRPPPKFASGNCRLVITIDVLVNFHYPSFKCSCKRSWFEFDYFIYIYIQWGRVVYSLMFFLNDFSFDVQLSWLSLTFDFCLWNTHFLKTSLLWEVCLVEFERPSGILKT